MRGARLFGWNQRPDARMIARNDPFSVFNWVGGVPPSLPLACQASALLVSYAPGMVSPAGLSPAT